MTGAGRYIVVLANWMTAEGQLNKTSRARLDRAAALARDDPSAILVTSGWGLATDPGLTIARVMADTAVRAHGLDPGRIRQSPRARDTVGDAVFFACDILAPGGPEPARVTVVTSAGHAPRAGEIFRFVLAGHARVETAATDETVSAGEARHEAGSAAAFRKSFDGIRPGDTEAIRSRLMAEHPFYNGTVYGPESAGATPLPAPPP